MRHVRMSGIAGGASASEASSCIGSPSCQGPVPALLISRWSPRAAPSPSSVDAASDRVITSAIGERQMFPVQTNTMR